MSEVYNPEAERFEQLESLELEARDLVKRRDQAASEADRKMLEKQLKEVEEQVAALKKRLRP